MNISVDFLPPFDKGGWRSRGDFLPPFDKGGWRSRGDFVR